MKWVMNTYTQHHNSTNIRSECHCADCIIRKSIKKLIKGEPQESLVYSVEMLKAMRYVGLYEEGA